MKKGKRKKKEGKRGKEGRETEEREKEERKRRDGIGRTEQRGRHREGEMERAGQRMGPGG
jgi:hypothetical protein